MLTIAAAIAVSPAVAVPTSCVSGLASAYEGLTEGCTVGGVLFTNFNYFQDTLNAPEPDSVMIDPVVAGLFNGFSITPVAPATTFSLSTPDSTMTFALAFDVNAYTYNARLDATGLTVTGGASVSVTSVITPTNPAGSALPGLEVSNTSPTVKSSNISPEASLNVVTTVLLQTDSTGTAQFSAFTSDYAVPEPGTNLLVGTVLALAILWVRLAACRKSAPARQRTRDESSGR